MAATRAQEHWILAATIEGDTPMLYRLHAAKVETTYETGKAVVLGSPPPNFRRFVEGRALWATSSPRFHQADDMLAAVIVALQAQGVRQNLMPSGIGGAFFGLRVGASGAASQGDILYIVYDQSNVRPPNGFTSEFDCTLTGMRDHVAFSWSMSGRGLSMFATAVRPRDLADAGRIKEELYAIVPIPRYAALVDRATSAVTLIDTGSAASKRFLALSPSRLAFDLELSSDLIQLLSTYPSLEQVRATGSVPFEFISDS
jgi:hypothetical protein